MKPHREDRCPDLVVSVSVGPQAESDARYETVDSQSSWALGHTSARNVSLMGKAVALNITHEPCMSRSLGIGETGIFCPWVEQVDVAHARTPEACNENNKYEGSLSYPRAEGRNDWSLQSHLRGASGYKDAELT